MMEDTFPMVSVISINFNAPEVTAEMIRSFNKVTYPNYEIIIVDNASARGNVDALQKEFPFIKLIKSKVNLGFAGGNNLGIREAKGEYILLLNNDTEVDSGFLEPMVKKFEENPEIGAASPKIYFHHTPGMLQFTGFSAINPITVRNHGHGHSQMDHGQFDQDAESYYAHGAAMMVPRKVIEKVGLMAEVYFLYYEELDWGQRIRDEGYKIFYIHNAVVYHKESVSTGRESPLKVYFMNRARIIYLRRHVKGFKMFLALAYQFTGAVPKNMITYLFKGQLKLLRAYSRAIGWNITNSFNKDIYKNPGL